MLSIRVIRKQAKRYPQKLNTVNRQFLPLAGDILVEEAKNRCPRDNGQLINSIDKQVERSSVIVGTNVEYAPYVEYGTRPHFIGGPVKTNRGWRYIGQHPGTTAQPFMRPALRKNRRNLKRLWKDLFRRVYG